MGDPEIITSISSNMPPYSSVGPLQFQQLVGFLPFHLDHFHRSIVCWQDLGTMLQILEIQHDLYRICGWWDSKSLDHDSHHILWESKDPIHNFPPETWMNCSPWNCILQTQSIIFPQPHSSLKSVLCRNQGNWSFTSSLEDLEEMRRQKAVGPAMPGQARHLAVNRMARCHAANFQMFHQPSTSWDQAPWAQGVDLSHFEFLHPSCDLRSFGRKPWPPLCHPVELTLNCVNKVQFSMFSKLVSPSGHHVGHKTAAAGLESHGEAGHLGLELWAEKFLSLHLQLNMLERWQEAFEFGLHWLHQFIGFWKALWYPA